jgi:hypothetical protein
MEHSDPLDTELDKKGRLYERNRHFLRFAYRAAYDPAGLQDA